MRAAIAGASIAAVTLAGCGSTTTATMTLPAVTKSVSPPAQPRVVVSPTSSPLSAKPVIVAKYTGNGDENTPSFTVPANWHLSWWYSCSAFGQQGNFVVTEFNTDGSIDLGGSVSVNELGDGEGPVATYAYNDAGSHYLQVASECNWQVVVVTG